MAFLPISIYKIKDGSLWAITTRSKTFIQVKKNNKQHFNFI